MTTYQLSSPLSVGVELELQLINPKNHDLIGRAKDLIRLIRESHHQDKIKPEVTQSMIEMNSSVHSTFESLHSELVELKQFLSQMAKKSGILLSGGGTHPFQRWNTRKIFPTMRFKNLSKKYGYLIKQFTVFALHVHIGCSNAEDAIYLSHVLGRYIPHFIALSASSPFYQGIDTGYHSTRANVVNAFPLSGHMPYVTNWKEFNDYFTTMKELKIIESMKDFYWDVRPKPEFGTVEIRVCDCPLTITKTVMIAAYIQTLARYLLLEKPIPFDPNLHLVYNYNRFQASRFGFDGTFVDSQTKHHSTVGEDILKTIEALDKHALALNTHKYISPLEDQTKNKENDASFLIDLFRQTKSLKKVVQKQCQLWMGLQYPYEA